MERPSRRIRHRKIAWTSLISVLLSAFLVAFYAEWRLSRLVLGGLGDRFSTTVFSAPVVLGEGGAAISPSHLLERLRRLNYRRTKSSPPAAGEFRWEPPEMILHLRGFRSPTFFQAKELVRLKALPGNGWSVSKPGEGGQAALEPEAIAEISGPARIRREPAKAEDIPETLKLAVISVEDRRFLSHWGVDFRSVVRAALHDIFKPGTVHGGSTITQQFAKNFFLNPKRTLRRKIAEAALAGYLEIRYTKRDILTLYLNEVYLGQDGSVSVAGVKASSQLYFGKNLGDLSLPQAALLAGMIRSPYLYNPFRNPEAAKERRDFVLKRMREEGAISLRQMILAQREPLRIVRPQPRDPDLNSYYVAEVLRQLQPRYGEDILFRFGLRIYTMMDPILQMHAQRILRGQKLQGALVAIRPRDGAVLALAGGREFKETQFNRATQARRQPGSAFKPFVYGAALEKGWTAASILRDQPQVFQGFAAGAHWKPKNYDGIYLGTTTVRDALAKSSNAAAIDLAHAVGTDEIADFAQRMGIESPLDRSLAMALGTSEVTLMELVSAYAPFANGGFRVSPLLISGVMDADGNMLEAAFPQPVSVLDPAMSYLMTSLLSDVIGKGTAKDLTAKGWLKPSAGKTGTTNGGRDAWFVGYVPRLLAGVWVGEDQGRAGKLSGPKDAAPRWAEFMQAATEDDGSEPFVQPVGIVTATIDPASGLLARSGCPIRREEIFIAGTQPMKDCSLHPRGFSGWLHRLFGRP